MTMSQDTLNNIRGGIPSAHAAAEMINALQGVHDMAAKATFGASVTGGSHVATMPITLLDANGNALTRAQLCDVYLSLSSTGVGLGAGASGAVTTVTNGSLGAVMVAGKMVRLISGATGLITLSVTDSSDTAWYVCVCLPNGKLYVSPTTLVYS